MLTSEEFSRIDKLFVDRDEMDPASARNRRIKRSLNLYCGKEVRSNKSLQAALLTSAAIGHRCFPGCVQIIATDEIINSPVVIPFPETTLKSALQKVAESRIDLSDDAQRLSLAFGSCAELPSDALQVTFNGWSGGVVPLGEPRLPEGDECILGGIIAGATGISELFLKFAGISVEAGRRNAGYSLWLPDADWQSLECKGPKLEYLPTEAWLLGLGHLGQAYAWCLSLLPYASRANVLLYLQDHDRIEKANFETGLLTSAAHVSCREHKTRVVANWMEVLGFRTTLIERPFDSDVRATGAEPGLALSGFDGSGPRHLLEGAGFTRIIDCGLGGTSSNFDAISLHTFPSTVQRASLLWPNGEVRTDTYAKKLAESNAVYKSIEKKYHCGHFQLAGRSVAVPFVGATAACFAISEILRELNGGVKLDSLEARLESAGKVKTQIQSVSAPTRLRCQKVN
jgi:hypothetical protein